MNWWNWNGRSVAMGLVLATVVMAQDDGAPRRAVTDPGVVTTRQTITPAGVPSIFDGRVYGTVWDPSGQQIWVLNAAALYRLDWLNNKVVSKSPLGGTPGLQSIALDRVHGTIFFGRSVKVGKGPAQAQLARVGEGRVTPVASGLGSYLPGAIGIAAGAGVHRAVVPLIYENQLALIDTETGKVEQRVATQTAPFAAVINAAGTIAYVSHLGGRPPRAHEIFASPMEKPEEKIPVDARGVASTGTVSRIDLTQGKVTQTIAVGLHPTAMAWDETHQKLYVANGNSESVSVIDTRQGQAAAAARTLSLQPFSDKVKGIAPTALALSRDGETLYVACGGINAIAVVATKTGTLAGLIPTAWYPNSLAISPDGKHLAVSSLLGPGSGWRDEPKKRFVHSYRGSVSVLDLPDRAQLASWTTAVAENNHLRLAGTVAGTRLQTARQRRPVAIPERSGEPSLIEHVVYIVKENRTYDQVLGDLERGNGDPSLVMFGKEVTPNQHRLATDFVLLDNFYATGGNSADGHQWLTQANETEYCLWPGYAGRSYPFDGSDPLAYSAGGFLWDYAKAAGKSVRIYGEYAGRMDQPGSKERLSLLKRWKSGEDFSSEWRITAPIAPMNAFLARNYPSYSTSIPDVIRAQIFLKDLKQYEAQKKFPHLTLIQLPSNHTYGTSPGVSTPKAMVADNDLALGQIVDALTHSPFWPKMAIFIVEDDAQNGVDHVDGHRTTCFVVSPYAKRGAVDSTFYSHQSILKTIELILGLPTMSLFDLIAHDMRASFQDTPQSEPFAALPATHDLFELNPPASALRGVEREGALASARMNWSVPDAVPTEKLNRILWGQIKGWRVPYPEPKRALFAPLSLEMDDDDR